MYKVLIVEDEIIVAEGIRKMIPWEQLSLNLLGVVYNGTDALHFIKKHSPDIIITDIKMPGISGIELINKAKEHNPGVKAIVLSGYSSFDYAKSVMENGVRFYLEKPCSEAKIYHALEETKKELDYERMSRDVLSLIKKEEVNDLYLQMLIENCVSENKELVNKEYSNMPVRLVVSNKENASHLNGLIARFISQDQIVAKGCTEMSAYCVISANEESYNLLCANAKKYLTEIAESRLIVTLSPVFKLRDINVFHNKSLHYLKYIFYYDKELLLIPDKEKKDADNELYRLLDEKKQLIENNLNNLNFEAVSVIIEDFFNSVKENTYPIELVKLSLGDLYFELLRKYFDQNLVLWNEINLRILHAENLSEIKKEFTKFVNDVKEKNIINSGKYDQIAYQLSQIIKNDYGEEELSLKWVSSHVLYLSSEYLGKIYYTKTGERFSNALNTYRIKKAKELLQSRRYKVYEVAKLVGFGDNSEYFSQIFKKQVGISPSRYEAIQEGDKN